MRVCLLGRVQGVFTSLVESLGVKDVQFEEIISLDVVSLQVLRYFFVGLLLEPCVTHANHKYSLLIITQSHLRSHIPIQVPHRCIGCGFQAQGSE